MSETLDPRSFHPGAIAVLELVAGGVDESAIKDILGNYEYSPDPRDRSFWRFKDNESVGLMIARESTLAIIVGKDEEHVENVNYVLSGIGWSTAILHSVSMDAEELVVESMRTLMIENIVRCWDEPPEEQTDAPPAANEIPNVSPNVGTAASSNSFARNEEGPAPAAPSRAAAPATDLPAAVHSVMRATPSGNEALLLKMVEDFVLPMLVPPPSHPVLDALKSAGYEVKYSLQRVG